jgi:hypothetical protein
MNTYIIEYIRQADDVPEVYIRHTQAESLEAVRAMTDELLHEVYITSISTVEEYRAFIDGVISDPDCSLGYLKETT